MPTTDTASPAADFGVLTLATERDHLKAIGLALSLRVSNPGVPVAVACPASARALFTPYFDHVVDEQPGLRGFVHKVHLDRYTPFRRTVFFDSDVLVFKPLAPYVERWGERGYTACGAYMDEGLSAFGLDRRAQMARLGKPAMVTIDGAGHAYFCAPGSRALFEAARDITANFRAVAGDIPYADEDVVAIAMTMLDIPPVAYEDFFSRYLTVRPGTLEMDASRGVCRFVADHTGQPFAPCMMHFANNEGAVEYTRQLIRLFRRFGVPREGLVHQGAADLFMTQVRYRVSRGVRALRRVFAGA